MLLSKSNFEHMYRNTFVICTEMSMYIPSKISLQNQTLNLVKIERIDDFFFHIRHQITLWEERETPVGTANDESMTWHEMCWASFVYLIKICREGTRPVSSFSKKQWYLFFWSVLINTRYLPSLHILERVQTYKEIIISIISSFSFTPKAQAHSQDHYLAPTDILSIFFTLSIADQKIITFFIF